MTFRTTDSMFFKQGTEKAHAVHDSKGRTYYIPRKLVKIVEEIEPQSEYDIPHFIVDIPDWIVRKNGLPIFEISELALER